MKKLLFISLGIFLLTVLAPTRSQAQVDSSCQIFGSGGSLNLCNGSIKRFYTKFIPGAIYGWSVSGNAVIVGPRNQNYVDIQGTALGSARICVSYSVNGQDPCCNCVNVQVIACGGGGGGGNGDCCMQYVNITYDVNTPGGPTLKIKFKDCNPAGSGIVTTRLFVSGVLWQTKGWGSPINPAYTYNHEIQNPDCYRIYCITICGYDINNNLLCCTSLKGIGTDCTNAIEWPASYCSGGGGGGGLPLDKTSTVKPSNGQKAQNFALAPNPAGSSIKITGLPADMLGSVLSITSNAGKVLKTVKVTAAAMDVDIHELAPGMYRIGGIGRLNQPYYRSFIKQ